MDCKLAELRGGADLTRTWIHMDMDAFFASVEELDNPSLVRPPQPIKHRGLRLVRLCI
jgi:DNA polymerase kappa